MTSGGTGRRLALDLGEARIGVALSDPLGIVAHPLAAVPRLGLRQDLANLGQLVAEYEIGQVIVGLPLHLSGEEGGQARDARRFAELLREHVAPVGVILWDERLTTVQAERVLIAADVRRRRRRRVIDGIAATLILQSFLDAQSCIAPAVCDDAG
jgi:putative Holliday junction resolvase